MYPLKSNNPLEQPQLSSNHHYYSQSISSQPSQTKQKTQLFKIQIRNTQLHNFKKKCRQQLLISQQIDSLLTTLPTNWNDSLQWSSDFMRLYNEVKQMHLDTHQILQIFNLTQKFPNRMTLQLLEIVILRASEKSIAQLFQYDIMRVLHTPVVYQDAKGNNQTLNRSCSSQESEAIIREAVVDRTSTAIARMDLNSEETAQNDVFQMVRTSVSIIGQMCQKSFHARNFAVITHKSFVYCLKAYKRYNESIRQQFFRFLKSATQLPFVRYQDQFQRIKNKILSLLFRQGWKIEYINNSSQCRQMLYCMRMLLSAAKNLLKNNDRWSIQKIYNVQNKCNYTLYAIAGNIIKDISSLLYQMNEIPQQVCRLLISALQLCIYYEETMIWRIQLSSSNIKLNQKMSVIIYYDVVYILHKTVTVTGLEGLRRLSLFALRNHLIDTKITEQKRFALLQIGLNNCHIKLLHLLNKLLEIQFDPASFYQVSYIIYSCFEVVPLQLLRRYLFESELINGICNRILQNHNSENKELISQSLLIRSLSLLILRINQQGNRSLFNLKSIIVQQYGYRFNNLLTKQTLQPKLYQAIQELLSHLEGEQWVQS